MAESDTEQRPREPFPASRAALIALGVTGFVLLFRPFGATVDSFSAFLVVAGLAPLNFAMMLGVHQVPLPEGRTRGLISVGAIALANTAYVSMWSAGANIFGVGFKVLLVAILTVAAIGLWNRQRVLQREVLLLKSARSDDNTAPIVLQSDDGKELLRLERSNLLFASARSNYVEVHHLKAGNVTSSLLRATLSGILAQTPEGALHQCHRSHLVNVQAAHRILKDARTMQIEFENASPIPVSRKFREAILGAARQ